MNFLHKRYSSSSGGNFYQSSTNSQAQIKTFLPPTVAVTNSPPQIGINNCDQHPNELIRHMCVECVDMLCSECISEHLELHRQAKSFPKIQSIKQVKIEMSQKMQSITHFMTERSPDKLDIDIIKKYSVDKIDQMKREIIRAVDEWVSILKNHLIQSIEFDQINNIKNQMEKLYEEVNILKNTLHLNAAPAIIKRIYQIDGDKLENGYQSMFNRYNELRRRSQFEFDINWKEIIKALELNVNVKEVSGKQVYIEEIHSEIESTKNQMGAVNQHEQNGFSPRKRSEPDKNNPQNFSEQKAKQSPIE